MNKRQYRQGDAVWLVGRYPRERALAEAIVTQDMKSLSPFVTCRILTGDPSIDSNESLLSSYYRVSIEDDVYPRPAEWKEVADRLTTIAAAASTQAISLRREYGPKTASLKASEVEA